MEKTFQKEDLTFIGNVLDDVKFVREGKLDSYMLSEDNAKHIRIFSIGPEHNCCISIGNTEEKEPASELFTFQPEDITVGIRNSEGHITLTASLKNCDMKFRSNNRNTYRIIESGGDHIKKRLKLHDDCGHLLFKMKPNALFNLINAMTIGDDSQSAKTAFTRFKMKEANKLEYYKYSTDSTAIFGYLDIEEGNTSHGDIAAFDGTFYISDSFHHLLNTLVGTANKDENGRLIEFYYNGHSITIKYTTDKDISVSLIFDGVHSDKENIDMISRMCKEFNTKFADIIMNTTTLLSTISDIQVTTNDAPCFMEFKDNNANIRSTRLVNNEPVYSNVITDVVVNTYNPAYDMSKFKLPIITSAFKRIIETYEKFDMEENDQVLLNLYELRTTSAGKTAKAYLIEIATEKYTGRIVAQPC